MNNKNVPTDEQLIALHVVSAFCGINAIDLFDYVPLSSDSILPHKS
jgi:hypothetical protein